MARKTTRRHSQGEASQRTILDATLRIAGARGYVGTTMAQVTKASGLPASSVYWHFANKDELLAAAFDHGFALWDSAGPPWSTADLTHSRAEELDAQLESIVSALDHEPGFWRMGLLFALETGPSVGSKPRERFLAVRATALGRITDWWALWLPDLAPAARDRHASTLALLTLVAIDGIFLAHQSDRDEDLRPLTALLAIGLDAAATRLADDAILAHRPGRPATPPRRVVEDEPDSSRSRLIAAAAEVAAESGYDGASIARICKRAGLPASSLYWHFKAKEDLLASVIEHSYQEWFLAQPGWLPPAPGTSWQDALRDHFAVSLQSLAARPLFLRMGHLLLLLQRDDPPAARASFVAVRRQARVVSREWYADVLGRDVDPAVPDALSELSMALSDGLFFSNQLDVPTWDVGLFGELVVTMLDAAAAVDAGAVRAG